MAVWKDTPKVLEGSLTEPLTNWPLVSEDQFENPPAGVQLLGGAGRSVWKVLEAHCAGGAADAACCAQPAASTGADQKHGYKPFKEVQDISTRSKKWTQHQETNP